MGNCCAAQKAKPLLDESKRPLNNPNRQFSSRDSDAASVNTRPSTPGLLDDDQKQGKDDSPAIVGDRRQNNLNQLEQLAPRDPGSQINSLQSSTLPGDGTSINSAITINKTHLNSPKNQIMPRSLGLRTIDRRSVISVVSEFKQDSIDLDEQVANAKEALHEIRKNDKLLSNKKSSRPNSSRKQSHMARLDLSLPPQPRKQIYQITSEFPVQRPYSGISDWQKVLSKYSRQQQEMINDKPVDPAYDDLAEILLALDNRNWIKDQIKMHTDNRMAMQDSLSNLVKQRQALQMREHFTWLVWAVAQYYFGAPDRSVQNGGGPAERDATDLDSSQNVLFHSRVTIPDQDISGFEDQEPSISQSMYSRQSSMQKPNMPNATKQTQPSQPAPRSTIFTCKLPKTNSTKWSEGFSFKGVYFRLLPYEDATHVLEEIKAMRYVQTELLDLQAQELAYLASQTSASGTSPHLNALQEGHLHKDVILPLLVGVKCNGFYLYGTPQIYTQEVKGDRGSIRVSDAANGFFSGNPLGTLNGAGSMVNVESEGEEMFHLPRISSVCAPEGVGFTNFDQMNRRGTFNYLHDNIDDETMRDPVLQRMPLMKNIGRRNLIPVIDFEEFNKASNLNLYGSAISANSAAPPSQFQINYLMVYLSSAMRTLSPESSTNALFTLPSPQNDEIIFHPYPQDRQIDYFELDQILSQQSKTGPGNASAKPLGDQEEQKGNLGSSSQQSLQALSKSFGRKFIAKHGWHCYMIEKRRDTDVSSQHQQFSRGINENKRASILFNQRENSAGGLEYLLEQKEQAMSVIIENNGTNESDMKRQSMHKPAHMRTPSSTNPFSKAMISGQENLESTPRLHIGPGIHHTSTRASQHIFVSPNKKTVMKRQENKSEELIQGNVVVSAVYTKGFKVLLSMTSHNYTNGIDTMFQLSLDQVAKIMENSDRVNNMDALKTLMHRKGLNLRFLWVLLTKVKLKQARDLIMVSILIRVMRKIVNEEVKIGSRIKKQNGSIPFMQHTSTNSASIFNQRQSQSKKPARDSSAQDTVRASDNKPVAESEYYQGNRSQLFRECLSLFANAVMKNKFAKYKQVFDETLLGLFLSRLKVMTLAHSLELTSTQLNYLESKDIIDHVLEMPSQNPILFLNAMQTYYNLDYKQEFARRYRQDKYFILNKPQPVGRSDITQIKHKVETYFTLRDQAYFILARKISSNQRMRQSRLNRSQNARDSNASLAKMFQRPRQSGGANNYNDTSMDQTPRADRLPNADNGSSGRQPFNQYNNRQGSNVSSFVQQDTHRNFQNFMGRQDSMASVGNNYQNIIDLSKTKRNNFRPQRCGEILLPPNLYKLHTSSNDAEQDKSFKPGSSFVNSVSSVFQPYYEMPNADVINEWVIVLESLLNEVYSVQGCEAVLLEALTHQCIMTLFLEQDADSSFKVLAKVRDLLHSAFTCPPELIVLCMMLTGLWQDLNEEMDQFPIESEKNYIAAMIIAFQIYGDPRGRGNYSIPYQLFFAWKLSLLSLAEGKKSQDSELSEELFDAALASLFNHKRMYKSNQLELVAAQEQAHSSSTLVQNNSNGNLHQPSNLNNSTFIRQGKMLSFEIQADQQDVVNSQFDLSKYRRRPQNVVTAGGFVKSSQAMPTGLTKSALKPNEGLMSSNRTIGSISKSQNVGRVIQSQQKKKENGIGYGLQASSGVSMNHMQKNAYEPDISDLDIEIHFDDDEDRQRLMKLNFRESETVVGKVPFPHWTFNRPVIQSQTNMLAGENPNDAKEMRKEMIRDQLTKQVDLEALFPWVVTYNPIMVQSGIEWNAKMIKEVVFCQNSQIVSTSEPSSVTFSSHKMSQYSYRSDTGRSNVRRRAFLNPYSTYIGKEVGGIQKGEILGQLYSWGTDQFGQLGLEYFITNKHMGAMQSLKILHPRLLMPLKDELIKEVCCGYAHTLAINQFGQMYSWGHNDSGQLGIGLEGVPDVVRKPVLNTHISNVAKLAAGHEHSLALTKTQELFVWGTGSLTGLDVEENVCIPTHLDFFQKARSERPLTSAANKISSVACGGLHTCVITQDGDLFTWGSAEGGQLGHPLAMSNDDASVTRPTRLEYLCERGLKIQQVSCGEAHTVVLTTEDQVWGWGMSMYGQLGLGFSGDSFEPGEGMEKSKVNTPTEITQYMPPEITISKIICGAAFTMFLTTENELYGCGINDLGQLGLDTYLEEMQIAVIDRARQAAGGIKDVITSDVTVPSRVICFEGLKVNTISCGESHSLALIGEEKSLWAWGMYRNGQLGLGEVSQKMNPRPVQSLHTTNVHKLAAGSQHSLALLGDTNQLTAMAANFFLNSDLLANPWIIDFRKLANDQQLARQNDISIAHKPKV